MRRKSGDARARGGRFRRWARRLAIALAALAGVLALAVAALLEVLDTRGGREWARPRIEALVSDAIPGELRIGRIEQATLARLVLRDVVVLDPRGREVLRVAWIEGRPSRRALARGVIGLRSVTARGVRARLIPSKLGVFSLIDAFDEPSEPSQEGGGPSTEVRVDRVSIADGEARLELEGMPIVLRDVEIEGSVRSADALAIVVTRAQLRAEHEGAPIFEVRELEGAYRSAAGARSTLRARLVHGSDDLRVRAAMTTPGPDEDPEAPPEVDLALGISSVSPRRVATALGEEALARELPASLRGRVELRGTTDRLNAHAVAHVAGATVRLDGQYRPDDVRAQLCTGGATLRALHASLPAITVEGCARAGARDLAEREVPVRLEIRGARVDGTAVPDLRVEGTVDTRDESVAIASLHLPRLEPGREDRLALTGEVRADGAMDLSLVARGLVVADDPALAALLDGGGATLDAQVSLSTTAGASRVHASVDATASRVALFGVRARRLAVRANAEGPLETVRFEAVATAAGVASGSVRVARARLHVTGTPDAAALALRGRLEGGEELAMRLAEARTGSVYAIDGRGRIGDARDGARFRVAGLRYDTRSGDVALRRLAVSHRDGRLFAHGSVRDDTLDGEVCVERLRAVALARAFAPDADVAAGTLSGTVRLSGTTSAPRASADLRLAEAAGFGFEDVTGTLVASLAPSSLAVDARVGARRRGSASISARARWPDGAPLTDAIRKGTYELHASLDATEIDLSGHALLHEEGLLATVEATDARGRVGEAFVRSALTPRALAEGRDPLDLPFDVDARLFERQLAQLPVRRPAWVTSDLRVEGRVALEGGRRATPLAAEVHAALRGDLRSMAAPEDDCDGVGAIALRIDGTLEDDVVFATLEADSQGEPLGRVELLGALPTARLLEGRLEPEDVVGSAKGYVASLELASLPVLCEMGDGVVDAAIAAADLGTPRAAVHVEARSRGARLGPRAVFDVDATMDVREGDATASIAMTSDVGGEGHVEARLPFTWGAGGVAPAIPGREVEVRARFDRLSLEPFAPVGPFVRRQAGTLDGYVEIGGTGDAPIARGRLALAGSTLAVPGLGQRLSDVDARVRFEPGFVSIERLRARDLQGSIDLRGDVRLDGLVPVVGALELDARRFPVRTEGIVTATLDARVLAKVTEAEDGLDAQVKFERLSVRIPSEAGRGVQDLAENPDIVYVDAYPEGWSPPEREREETDAPSGEPTLIEELTPFHVHVDATDPFWVRRHDLSVQLTARLEILIGADRTTLTGEVRTIRGFVELVGSRFEIDEGSIRFVGGETVDPLLDVTALANAETVNEVTVRITGRLSEPVLTFQDRSGAELTAGDALQCITSSRCAPGEAATAQSDADAEALTQQARGQLASVTAGLLSAVARQGAGERMPQISVTTGEDVEDVTVRAGFQANRLIPEALRRIVKSLYIEGYVGSESVTDETGTRGAQSSSTRATGGFLIEMRHPRSFVTRGRYEPPASWSLDMTWQP